MTDRPLALPFPMPDGPELSAAYKDLYLAAEGDDETKEQIGDPALLPRPWDPPTCRKRQLRQELWEWLDAVVTWFNTEYVWDPGAGIIPPCWPQHPHLVHEIAVLADQRRRASIDTRSNSLEEWHRYVSPAFLERLRLRTKSHCDERHQAWPARARFSRYMAELGGGERQRAFKLDVETDPHKGGRISRVIMRQPDEVGHEIDPGSGRVV